MELNESIDFVDTEIQKYLYENVLPLFTILKRFQAAYNFELDFFR